MCVYKGYKELLRDISKEYRGWDQSRDGSNFKLEHRWGLERMIVIS